MHPAGRDRRRQRSARLDEPPARLLAAGAALACPARHADKKRAGAGPATSSGWNGRGVEHAPRRRDVRGLPGARRAQVGPVHRRRAARVDYHPVYHPFNWRGWVDWGQGALGDMGAHLVDFPSSGRSTSGCRPPSKRSPRRSTWGHLLPERHDDVLRVRGPATGKPDGELGVYDGGLLPPRPAELGDEMMDHQGRDRLKDEVNKDGGVMFVGTKGKLMHETYGYNPRLLPQSGCTSRTASRSRRCTRIQNESHEMNWVEADQGGRRRRNRRRSCRCTPRGSSR